MQWLHAQGNIPEGDVRVAKVTFMEEPSRWYCRHSIDRVPSWNIPAGGETGNWVEVKDEELKARCERHVRGNPRIDDARLNHRIGNLCKNLRKKYRQKKNRQKDHTKKKPTKPRRTSRRGPHLKKNLQKKPTKTRIVYDEANPNPNRMPVTLHATRQCLSTAGHTCMMHCMYFIGRS